MRGYSSFIESKKQQAIISGFDIDENCLNHNLFDFQRAIVKWALKRGKAAIFADTGLGKTMMQTSWAHAIVENTGQNVLIVAPLCVAHQTMREGQKFGIQIHYCRSGDATQPGINITNYEMIDKFDMNQFVGIVLDECFPWDTKIDVLSIDGICLKKYIKDIKIGDRIANASGVDIVSDIHRREVLYAVKTTINGVAITSSPNHPYFTQRGWIGASDLRADDYVMESNEAMRLVRYGVHANIYYNREKATILRSILLSEMADATAGESGEDSFAGSSEEEMREKICMVQNTSSGEGDGAYHGIKSDAEFENAREIEPYIESNEAQTFRAWGERDRINSIASGDEGCVISDLGNRVSFIIGKTKSRVFDTLQDGLSDSREKNRHRGGWSLSPQQEGSGYQKGCHAGFARVDSVEILECGHPELEKYRDADGKLYFYDLGGTRHPSFSINGLLVHNSSILKNQDGKTRNSIIDSCRNVPYRLSCTATPSPNDFMELGNQCEFLSVMGMQEMLATYFINDAGDTGTWILKGHAKIKFWEWIATWATVIRNPSDLGFDGEKYILPDLNIIEHVVKSEATNELFPNVAVGLLERNMARKESVDDRVAKCADIVNASSEQFVIWCHRNEEASKLTRMIPGAVDVSGSDSMDHKEKTVNDFLAGNLRVMISKPKILGSGMNFQNCHNTVFVGLSDSWEQYYQAIRRFYRFGQSKIVNVHVISAETEGAVVDNIKRKELQNKIIGEEMIKHMAHAMKKEIFGATMETDDYSRDVFHGDGYTLHNADCIELAREIESDSIGFTIYSPPFSSLFTYSNSDRDMGNSKSDNQFFEHFSYLVDELLRITVPGRLMAVHVMNLTTSKANDGFIGLRDFRGDMIRLFVEKGWIYHSEVCIWKDPVVAMQRTKALGLLHKTIKKDSSMSRQGLADYLIVMRKPGKNPDPISHTADDFPVEMWQRYASPVWFDINQSRTLNFRDAREDDDVKHICPLQLDVIERAMDLWSKPGDLVFSPFTGVGSEGYVAVEMGRKFIGSELKKTYWQQSCKNIGDLQKKTKDMFTTYSTSLS